MIRIAQRRAEWEIFGREYGYGPPDMSTRWKRLPGIRHVRSIYGKWMVERHYRIWRGVGVRTGFDEWVLFAIWHGFDDGRFLTEEGK